MQVQVNSDNNNTVTIGSLDFLMLGSGSQLDFKLIKIHDAIVIQGFDNFYTEYVVREIRKHFDDEVYLKPIFLLKKSNVNNVIVNELIDGVVFGEDQLDLLVEQVKEIYLIVNNIVDLKSTSFEAEIINKTINFMVSRGKKHLNAIASTSSVIGYSFPELSINFDSNDEHKVFEILEIAENEGFFTSTFVDRTYLCTNCSGGFLSYREVCPACNSSNSETEDLVHHFPCAYVGPIHDFRNTIDDDLNCPKCNKTLRHIGVDYDKPSVLHTCKKCSHQYQDFNVKAKCVSCSFDNQIDLLISKEIRSYSLTKKGEMIAYKGFISTSSDFSEVPGTVKYDVFKIMLRYEIERLRQNDYTSNIGYVHLSNAGEIYSRLGLERQKSLIAEMIGILRNNLRSSDFISFYDASTLVLSMNEIPTKIANKILKEIAKLTQRLINKNFKTLEIEMETRAIPLDTELSHELQLQNLIRKVGVLTED